MKLLIDQDFINSAARIGCKVAAVKAVCKVEAPNGGFDVTGNPTLLFERHIFHRYTKGKYDKSHPHLSNETPGGYGATGVTQQNKFQEAMKLDKIAAIYACSWGKFQIMGFNFAVCGFKTLDAFVKAMQESEGKQLEAFINFVINSRLNDELQRLDWAGFAKGYNGKNYHINNYDGKLSRAFILYNK
jgi:hypothetical protein